MGASHRSRLSPGKRDRRRPGIAQRVLAGDPSHSAAVSIVPPALREGQSRCGVCRNAISLTPSGHLRKHRDLFGHPCFNKQPEGVQVALTELPPVVLGGMADYQSTLGVSPNGRCHECSKPIPPGRRLCGRCMSGRKP